MVRNAIKTRSSKSSIRMPTSFRSPAASARCSDVAVVAVVASLAHLDAAIRSACCSRAQFARCRARVSRLSEHVAGSGAEQQDLNEVGDTTTRLLDAIAMMLLAHLEAPAAGRGP